MEQRSNVSKGSGETGFISYLVGDDLLEMDVKAKSQERKMQIELEFQIIFLQLLGHVQGCS